MGIGQALRLTPQLPYVCPTCHLRAQVRRYRTLAPRRFVALKSSLADTRARDLESVKFQADLDGDEKAAHVRTGRNESILSLLERRGFVNQVVGEREDLDRLLSAKRVGVYVGIDPTGPSLHVGHLVPLMALYWMYSHGFPVFAVLGGATARIGDPSGRIKARSVQSDAEQTANADEIHQQMEKLWINTEKELTRNGISEGQLTWQRELVNNRSWLEHTPMMEIMRLLLPGVRLGTMLGRDSVRNRMKEDGMSVAEFLYPIIQAWDFWHLYSTKSVQIQIGGSDQFGNILAGMDAIKFIRGNHEQLKIGHDHRQTEAQQAWRTKAMGFTTPLLTTTSGEKFGKSAGNAIWLDPHRTSPFDLYQFFLGTADDDVHRYLQLFTFESLESLDQLMKSHDSLRSKRLAQHALAMAVLRLVHGDEVAEKARNDHARLFPSRLSTQKEQIEQTAEAIAVQEAQASSNDLSTNVTLPRSLVFDRPLDKILFQAGLARSRTAAKRLCDADGAYVGTAYVGVKAGVDKDGAMQWRPVNDADRQDAGKNVINGDTLFLRAGKTKVRVVKIVSDEDFEARSLAAPGWPEGQDQEENPL